MKAVVATGYGPPEKYAVADVPVPRPGPGQIQVRIAAASINPADVRLPGGHFRDEVVLEFRTYQATTSPARSARSASV